MLRPDFGFWRRAAALRALGAVAVLVLGAVQIQRHNSPTGRWVRALRSSDVDVRFSAASVMGAEAPEDVGAEVSGLAGALRDQEPAIRARAALSLGQILGRIGSRHPRSPSPALVDAVLVAALGALKDPDPSVRASAAEALVNTPPEPGVRVRVIRGLLDAARDGEPDERAAAVRSLSVVGPASPDVRSAVSRAAREEGDARVRAEAVTALGAAWGREDWAYRAVVAALRDRAPEVRKAARYAIHAVQNPPPAVTPDLVGLLAHRDRRVIIAATAGLSRIGLAAGQAVPALLAGLAEAVDREDPDVIAALAAAMRKVAPGSPETEQAKAVLAVARRSARDPETRSGAGAALDLLNGVESEPRAVMAVPR